MDADTLFNLGFKHWEALLLSFIPALVTLTAIIHLYSNFPAYKINRVYILFLLSVLAWQVNDSFCRMSLSEQTAKSWDRLLSVTWMMLFPTTAQFTLLFTGHKKAGNNFWLMLTLYLSVFIFAMLLCGGVYSQSFTYSPFWGWIKTFNNVTSFQIVPAIWLCMGFLFNLLLYALFAIRNRKSDELRYVSFSLLIAFSITVVQGIFTQVILPLIFRIDPIPVTSTFMMSIIVAIAGLNANRIFNLSETLDTERITEIMQEIIFVVSPEKLITYINPYGAAVTKLTSTDKRGLSDLFLNAATYEAFESQVIRPGFQHKTPSHLFFSKEDESIEIHWDVSTYPIFNKNNVNGLLVMCRDVSDRILMGEAKLASLRSQMNPHFIFNSLNSIQHYIHSNQREAAENFLSTFAVLIRQILDNSAHSFIPLSDELHSIQLYLELEKARFQSLSCVINVDGNIDTESLSVPSMLIQPYIENAILHGLSPKKEDAVLSVQITRELDLIVCCIKDNGIGRKLAMEMNNRRKIKRASYGLSITQARLDLLNNKMNFPVEVKITDLYNDDRQPYGTLVEIRIPVQERF